jgi:hypothetical protein
MSAQSVKKVKRPRVVTILETKLKIIRNVEAGLRCYKEVLTEIKKVRIQPTLDYFFKETGDLQPSTHALKVSSTKLLNIKYFLKI